MCCFCSSPSPEVHVNDGDGLHTTLYGGHRHVGDVQTRGMAHLAHTDRHIDRQGQGQGVGVRG